jgi:uncharacterized protein (DUF433 family)
MDIEDEFARLSESHKPEIVCNPKVQGGKPCFKGTRLPIEAILACLAGGDTREQIYNAYPSLPLGGIEAAVRWDIEQRRAA